ncbi:hypothetical protein HPB52_021536 [Rhipicephalus sanguineus]|uniref:Uncharacterized protein n=1 Tax=Rhipicephalus sanguineus TaxID=34632 RepID=A0A9D4SPG2_RHISA|nr:hypothetical protein HPB52_021536 [Rhipicephalus sanguineus]
MSRRPTPRPLMRELCAQGTRSTVDALGSCVLVSRTLSVPVCTRRRGLAQPRTRSWLDLLVAGTLRYVEAPRSKDVARMTSVGRLSEEPEEPGAMAVENTGPPVLTAAVENPQFEGAKL